MSVDEITTHATRYSQSFKKGFGIWKDNFTAMAIKTVLKLLISKYGSLSVDMQTAIKLDQSSVNEELEVEEYTDTVDVLDDLTEDHLDWLAVYEALKDESISIDEVKSKYNLTEENEAKLCS